MIPGADEHFRYPGYSRDYLAHPMLVTPDSQLRQVLGVDEILVNSMHHQSINGLGQGLRVIGKAPDGVIEAIEATDRPYVRGVQWHAETLVHHGAHLALFGGLVEAATA